MTPCAFNILIVFTIYLGFVLFPSHGFEVIQPENVTVNPDGSALITCELNATNGLVKDVKLYSVSSTGEPTKSLLCQKGLKHCKNVVMYQENQDKYLLIILNIDEEAMNTWYQCDMTVEINDIDDNKRGKPTRLLPVGQSVETTGQGNVPPPPSPAQPRLLWWILIGLLALVFLYGCVITSFYIKQRISSNDLENSTYVEMRKGPLPRRQVYDIYCG